MKRNLEQLIDAYLRGLDKAREVGLDPATVDPETLGYDDLKAVVLALADQIRMVETAVRLLPHERLDIMDYLITLAGQATVLGYPHPQRLPQSPRDLEWLTNAELVAKRDGLVAWISQYEPAREPLNPGDS